MSLADLCKDEGFSIQLGRVRKFLVAKELNTDEQCQIRGINFKGKNET